MLRRVESWDGWLATVLEGRGGMGKKKGKKKEKQRKKCRQSGYIMAFTDGISDVQVPPVKVPRHYTAILV